ncbi:MAG: hypothetical protein HXY23_05550 [Parvularculaceae bacterium]|jgi:hypothetical protein|nr:hypothetical protein [Parvularculaceae bacterium]
MTLSERSLVLLAALAVWFGLDFVGAPGLVSREALVSPAGAMMAALAIIAILGVMRVRLSAALFLAALALWAALQIETHWATYLLVDASESKLRWYERVFGDNWRFLPLIAGRTTPDGYHAILAGLILVNMVSALADCLRKATSNVQ